MYFRRVGQAACFVNMKILAFGVAALARTQITGDGTTLVAGTGAYQLTFSSPLAPTDFDSTAGAQVLVNGPGFVRYASGGAAGRLLVRTYSAAGALTGRGFSFVIFQP